MPTTVIINKNFEEVAQVKGYVDWLSPEYINFIKSYCNFFSKTGNASNRSATRPKSENLKIGASSSLLYKQ